jgi:hypothetical protein
MRCEISTAIYNRFLPESELRHAGVSMKLADLPAVLVGDSVRSVPADFEYKQDK